MVIFRVAFSLFDRSDKVLFPEFWLPAGSAPPFPVVLAPLSQGFDLVPPSERTLAFVRELGRTQLLFSLLIGFFFLPVRWSFSQPLGIMLIRLDAIGIFPFSFGIWLGTSSFPPGRFVSRRLLFFP